MTVVPKFGMGDDVELRSSRVKSGQMNSLLRSPWAVGSVLLVVAAAVFLSLSGTRSGDPLGQAPSLFPGWTWELYRTPKVAVTEGTLELAGSGSAEEESGVYLRSQIDSGKVYRLRIDGTVRGGSPLLRTKLDDNEPSWLLAPDGLLNVTVAGGSEVEALVYGRGEFSYELKSLRLEPCDDCLTDAGLREHLLTKIPELAQLVATDEFSAASQILDWAANAVDGGGGIQRFEALSGALTGLSASQIYQDIWLTDAGGASCDGFAVFLQKVFSLLGINAFTVDMGLAGTPLTHVTTVIAADDGRFYVFDPTLNGVYAEPSGKLADLETMLVRGVVGGTFRTRPISRTILYAAASPNQVQSMLAKQLGVHGSECALVNSEYVRCVHVPYNIRYLRYGWAADLAKYQIVEDPDLIIALMRRAVIRVSHTAGEDVRQRFIAMLQRAGVPVQAQ
jgi:hypothetical protein